MQEKDWLAFGRAVPCYPASALKCVCNASRKSQQAEFFVHLASNQAVADLSALDAAAAGVTASTMPSLVEGEGDPEVTLRDLFAGDGSALPTMPRFPEEKVGAASA
eukprot:s1756_g4.t2